jgi:hypothetical protein
MTEAEPFQILKGTLETIVDGADYPKRVALAGLRSVLPLDYPESV